MWQIYQSKENNTMSHQMFACLQGTMLHVWWNHRYVSFYAQGITSWIKLMPELKTRCTRHTCITLTLGFKVEHKDLQNEMLGQEVYSYSMMTSPRNSTGLNHWSRNIEHMHVNVMKHNKTMELLKFFAHL